MISNITLIGNVNLDLVMGPVSQWPSEGTEVVLPHSEWRVGGAAGNTALALQALDARFRMVTSRGDDDFGMWLTKPFQSHSVNWKVSPSPTGFSLGITHPSGERTFFTTLGHLSDFRVDDVAAQLPNKAAAEEIALLCGTFVMPALQQAYDELIALLRGRGFKIALDTGWPTSGWTEMTRAAVLRWCCSCDHVLFNELEARSLVSMQDAPLDHVARSLSNILPSDATVIIKCGALGAMACKHNVIMTQAAPDIAVVDTIGAGDVFNAGYLWALTQGMALRAALQTAVDTASTAIATHPRSYVSNLKNK